MATTSITRDDLRDAIPQQSGTLRLDGLDGPAEVVRDRIGVAHIRAGSRHDAFFAQGFVHAQDRLWHMEYDRRRAAGRWAEYAGPGGVEQDTVMRRLRLTDRARADYAALNAETRAMLDTYAAGVNAFLSTTGTLPIEYRLVGGTPEPWEPWHSCAVFHVRHVLMSTMRAKLWRLRVLKTLGEEWVERLRAGAGEEAPLMVPPGATYQNVPDAIEEGAAMAELLLGLDDLGAGSNNWVLHGRRTESGKPLLAGDPHRAIDVPNVYYPNHLACPDFDAIGFSFVGVPAFPHFGHNAHVAWGVTTANADYQDLYVERFKPGDPSQYEDRGSWREADRRRETIQVRGAAPVEIEATATHHGPIVVGDPAQGHALALKYVAIAGPNRTFDALLPMLRARMVAELDEAKRSWVAPDNNFVMADTSGTIGYLTRGQVPVRSMANAWLPVPGWTGEHEWQGQVPFEEMPRARNPEQGFIATANQRVVGRDFPHYVSIDWSPPYRAERVNARLRPLTAATAADMPTVHADKRSIPSAGFVELAREIEPRDEASAAARTRLLGWDGVMGPESQAAAIYAVWRERITAALLAGPTFAPLMQAGGRYEALPSQAIPLAQRVRDPFYALMLRRDPSVLPPGETWVSLGARALADAVAWLAERLGPDQDGWHWDRIHRTRPRHTLSGAFPELADLLDPPAVGVGGDGDTPQAGTFDGMDARECPITATSVARYCFDLADWDRSGWIIPLGVSGHPGSPHYADQVTAWSEQRLAPMLYSWERIDADAEVRLHLVPGR
ncbi:MAG: penicillin acylase family protein [Chloroflexi bacterium]|nr:penicillin acylase family protein [Chloroflexota bacterium]